MKSHFYSKINLNKNKQKGFIALLSALFISVIFLSITISLSQNGFFIRSNTTQYYWKTQSKFLAKSCIEKVLLEIYLGLKPHPRNYIIDSDKSYSCSIHKIKVSEDPNNPYYTIYAQATFKQSYSYIVVEANEKGTLLTLKECPNLIL
jgi:hypothetical protein